MIPLLVLDTVTFWVDRDDKVTTSAALKNYIPGCHLESSHGGFQLWFHTLSIKLVVIERINECT